MLRQTPLALHRRPGANKKAAYFLEQTYLPRNRYRRTNATEYERPVDQQIQFRRAYDPEYKRYSFWVSDFKHRYLIKTGQDYKGEVPLSAAPGTYQTLRDKQLDWWLGGNQQPQRESLHLPVRQPDPRIVNQDFQTQRLRYLHLRRDTLSRVNQLRDVEFFEWYTKLQRVRGRWCKEQGVASRGAYGPAVDAAELWS
jgi:hypothetical protein